ncbi:MAG: hypothetical protein V2A34_09595 [Lentisphaerota bacterium]
MKQNREADQVMEAMKRSVQDRPHPAIPENWTAGVMEAIQREATAGEMNATTLSIWPLAWAAAGAAAAICLVSWAGWLEPADASLAWLWLEEPNLLNSLFMIF